MAKVLAVAVHPDDETLGCGGTLLRHKKAGDEIFWLVMTGISEAGGWPKDFVARRSRELDQVKEAYGFEEVFLLNHPSTALDQVPRSELIHSCAAVIQSVKPQIVYLPFFNDAHSDHRISFEVAESCLKSFRAPFVRKVLMMETPSETDFASAAAGVFIPNYFVDISPFLERKIAIMAMYSEQMQKAPFPRSVENLRALAVTRGASCGSMAAEAFMVVKIREV